MHASQRLVSLQLDMELLADIEAYCRAKGMTRSQFFRAAAVEKLQAEGCLKVDPEAANQRQVFRGGYAIPATERTMLNEDAPAPASGLVVKPDEMPPVGGVSPHVAGMATVGQRIADGIVAEKRKDRAGRKAASPTGSKAGPAR